MRNRYQVEELLGEGGESMVYRACDALTGRIVAIKIGLGVGAKQIIRLIREAHVLSRVRHPAVIDVLDAGVLPDGCPLMVTEYVDGTTLDQLSPAQRPSADLSVMLVISMAKALQCVHAAGYVHRDVKPRNMLVPSIRDGHGAYDFANTRLIDFGMAGHLVDTMPSGRRVTRPGRWSGTPAYMAPEQLQGRRQSPATDVYGLGSVLFELLYGSPPHCGEGNERAYDLAGITRSIHVEFVMDRLVRDASVPDLSHVPPGVRACITQSLRADPDARWTSMNAFAAALEPVTQAPHE